MRTAASSGLATPQPPNPGDDVSYYGGDVIENVNVIQVNWTSSVNSTVQSQMPLFYQAFTQGPLFQWLPQYDTDINDVYGNPGTQQSIGNGSYGGSYTITPSNTSTTLSQGDVQAELSNQILYGPLPLPAPDTLYVIHFPSNITLTAFGGTSCAASANGFCGYHSSYTDSYLGLIRYVVLPSVEAGTGCDLYCAGGGTYPMMKVQEMIASHEILEAVTDPDPDSAWYTTNLGGEWEVGDLCSGQPDSFVDSSGTSWWDQRLWSNDGAICVGSKPVVQVGLSNQYSGFDVTAWHETNAAHVLTGDFNGDGKTDILTIDTPNGTTYEPTNLNVGISNGASFTDASGNAMGTSTWATTSATKNTVFRTGDFNGDGYTDVAEIDVSGTNTQVPVWVFLNNGGTGFKPRQLWASTWYASTLEKFLVGHFSGLLSASGHPIDDLMRIDVLGSTYGSHRAYVGLPTWNPSTGTYDFTSYEWGWWNTSSNMVALAGDFDGNGRTDVAMIDVAGNTNQPTAILVAQANAGGQTCTLSQWEYGWPTSTQSKFLVGDFHGAISNSGHPIDDLMEFVVTGTAYASNSLLVGIATDASGAWKFPTTTWATWQTGAYMKVLAGDFNGDGLTDVMKFDVGDTTTRERGIVVGISNGSSFAASQWGGTLTSPSIRVLSGDFNGDRITDILKIYGQ